MDVIILNSTQNITIAHTELVHLHVFSRQHIDII